MNVFKHSIIALIVLTAAGCQKDLTAENQASAVSSSVCQLCDYRYKNLSNLNDQDFKEKIAKYIPEVRKRYDNKQHEIVDFNQSNDR